MTGVSSIFDALCKHLADNQLRAPALRVSYPGITFKPASNEVYLRASIFPNAPPRNPVGKGDVPLVGIFQAAVSFPNKNEGYIPFQEVAESIIEQFKKGTLLYTADGQKIKVPSQPWQSPVVDDPVRPLIPVSIPYEAAHRLA